jgi:mono/diheme cytochrome c family protein
VRLRLLLVAALAATVGAALGYWFGQDQQSAVPSATSVPTVTATETDDGTAARPNAGGNTRTGRRVFVTTCARCHALKRGDWTGRKINLTALQPAYGTTVAKVTRGGIAMPSFDGKLSKRQIRDVAAFVTREIARQGRGTP